MDDESRLAAGALHRANKPSAMPASASWSRRLILFALCALMLLAVGVWLVADLATWTALVGQCYASTLTFIRTTHPVLVWLTLTLLPLLGFPVAPLLIAVGVRFHTPSAFFVAGTSILANLLLSHVIGNCWLRALLTNLLRRLGHKIPLIPAGQHRRVTFLLRITPGVPVFAANYLLVLGGVNLADYVLISFPIQLGFAAGFLLLGGSFSGGSLTSALFVLVLLVALKIVLQQRASANGPAPPKNLQAAQGQDPVIR